MKKNTTNSSSPNTTFRTKSHKILRVKTLQKQPNIEKYHLNPYQPLINHKTKINTILNLSNSNLQKSIKNIRKYTEIQDQLISPPKTIKLSPFKQYESKLKLSAESWVIFDLKTNKYKRGWKANKSTSFRGSLRVLVLLCYCQLVSKNENIKRLRVKIAHNVLKQGKTKRKLSIKKMSNNLLIQSKINNNNKTFQQGTILYLIDLIKSMIISGNDDLLEYSLIYCGYLVSQIQKQPIKDSISFDDILQLKQQRQNGFIKKIIKYMNQEVIINLGLKQTFIEERGQYFELISTPNQISCLFQKAFTQFSLFREIVSMQRHHFYIKFQVGYNYWEERIFSIESSYERKKAEHFCYLVYKRARNFQCICYNKELQILMVIEDSKFSMADLDIRVLQNWYVSVTKPISSNPRQSLISPQKKKPSLFPLLQISKAVD